MNDSVQEAIDEFTNACEANPENYRALNNRALAWRHMGVVDQALSDFDASLSILASQAEVRFLKGQTYFELRSSQEAIRELKLALKLDPDHPEARELLKRLGTMSTL